MGSLLTVHQEHETLSPTEAAVLPSTQFKQRGIKPQLVVDGTPTTKLYLLLHIAHRNTPAGVPIAELQPRYNPVEDLLFFSHIPRTAGGTFSVLLSALFPTQEQVPYSGTGSAVRDLTAYKSITAEQWRDMHVLFAHEDLSFVKLIPKHVAVTVFLRDPIKVLPSRRSPLSHRLTPPPIRLKLHAHHIPILTSPVWRHCLL